MLFMKKLISFLLVVLYFGSTYAQDKNVVSEDLSITPLIDGTLLLPDPSEAAPMVIIIGDSGPVDRNGNQMMMKNNALRFLAEGLSREGIASFRYDKRLVKIMKKGAMDESKINFSDFIEDANAIISHFKNDKRFSKIYVLGHGQGSLVGMIAAQGKADGFISIAGAGQELDDVIVAQLEQQAPGLKDNARQAFDDLRATGVAVNYSPGISSIFRKEIQPFIYSWMQYNPKKEIAKLSIPVLIINGDKDLQVQVSEAELLKAAKPDAQYKIIKDMNHIFKEIRGDDIENSKSYNEYNRPIIPTLLEVISSFILS